MSAIMSYFSLLSFFWCASLLTIGGINGLTFLQALNGDFMISSVSHENHEILLSRPVREFPYASYLDQSSRLDRFKRQGNQMQRMTMVTMAPPMLPGGIDLNAALKNLNKKPSYVSSVSQSHAQHIDTKNPGLSLADSLAFTLDIQGPLGDSTSEYKGNQNFGRGATSSANSKGGGNQAGGPALAAADTSADITGVDPDSIGSAKTINKATVFISGDGGGVSNARGSVGPGAPATAPVPQAPPPVVPPPVAPSGQTQTQAQAQKMQPQLPSGPGKIILPVPVKPRRTSSTMVPVPVTPATTSATSATTTVASTSTSTINTPGPMATPSSTSTSAVVIQPVQKTDPSSLTDDNNAAPNFLLNPSIGRFNNNNRFNEREEFVDERNPNRRHRNRNMMDGFEDIERFDGNRRPLSNRDTFSSFSGNGDRGFDRGRGMVNPMNPMFPGGRHRNQNPFGSSIFDVRVPSFGSNFAPFSNGRR